ncbi:unnamed protein product [Blepharisma stoltei]|uniref:Trichohyalin-plectin-homology domain-containing protein n=1 Tax=Blepharisma stoltei TaxID=1481888 RepID=A0AAU9J6Y9_9CILI|nr:unnamed protein product [Blepharisma stoltei]
MSRDLAKNVAVISASDLDRMRRTCLGIDPAEQEQKLRQAERQELHEKSRVRMKNWGNSVDAIREKKELERFKKFEAEELERRRLDAEEEALNQEKRRQAIEYANKILHDEGDQVKAFHSKMFLSDVLQERELQLEINKKKKDNQKEVEERWVDLEHQQLKEYDEALLKKIEEEERKKKETQKILKDQLVSNKEKIVRKLQDEYIEGKLMKKKAIKDLQAEKREELERRKAAIAAQNETKKMNEHFQELKRLEQERIKEEERKIEEYAKQKEEVMNMRKRREEQKFKEKLETRQKMIDARIEELSKIKSNEDQRLQNQVQEAEQKAKETFEKKQQRHNDMMTQIERSRQHQIDRKKQEKEQEKMEDKEFAQFWKERMQDLNEMEKNEAEERRDRAKAQQLYHKKQMDYKARKVEQEALLEEELARQSAQIMEDEQNQFNSYAEKCLKEWAENGKNITPMILELKNYKKRIA